MAKYIDADEAILEIEKHLRIGDEIYQLSDKDRYTNDGLIVAADVVYHQPAADVEPVRRWIPCSERMPEEDYETGNGTQFSADVLTTVVNHANDDECYVWLLKTVDGKWYDHILNKDRPTDFPYWCEVIAWMPLPAPCKGGEQNG